MMKKHLSLRFSWFVCLVILCVVAVGICPLWAQDDEGEGKHSTLTLLPGYRDGQDAKIHWLGLKLDLGEGWKTYWRNPGDAGEPLRVTLKLGAENADAVTVLWPAPERLVEADINLEVYVHKHQVVWPLAVALRDAAKPASGELELFYNVCSDICIPVQATVPFRIEPTAAPGADAAEVQGYQARVPQPNNTSGMHVLSVEYTATGQKPKLLVKAQSATPFTTPDVFVEGPPGLRFPQPEVVISEEGRQAAFTFAVDNPNALELPRPETLRVTLVSGGSAVEINTASSATVPATPEAVMEVSIVHMLLFAFIGGVILNVMPCVLPVLSLKLFSVIKMGKGHRHEVRESFLITAAGILFSFWVLAGLTIAVRAAGGVAGWGFHFQEPAFLIVLILIITLFACNLWGLFEIRLPVWLGGKISDMLEDKRHSKAGNFTTGALATLLATPCTAPFLGTAVGFALSRGAPEILMMFSMMGIGLATPYLLVAMFPGCARVFPKPGAWMGRVKAFLGVLLLLSIAWLLWILAEQTGVINAAAIGIFCGVMVFTLWRGRKKPMSHLHHISMALVAALALLGVFGITRYTAEPQPQAGVEGLWKPFDQARIPSLVAEGKVVLVDVTATWCLTCKANHLLVLRSGVIQELLTAPNVVAMRADWTNRDPAIAAYLQSFKRYGIPFNVVYGPGVPQGLVLPELLTETVVREALTTAQGE